MEFTLLCLCGITEQNAKSQEEAEELFAAIQEIALNLEQKKAECTQLTSENGISPIYEIY